MKNLPQIHIKELEKYVGEYSSIILINGPQYGWEKPFLIGLGGYIPTWFLLWEKQDEPALELAVETAFELGMKGIVADDPWTADWFHKEEMIEEWEQKFPGEKFEDLDYDSMQGVYCNWEERGGNVKSIGDYWIQDEYEIIEIKDLPVYINPDDRLLK